MKNIDARSKIIGELLSEVKYSIDYFQREYKWQTENIVELLNDLEAKFISNYDEGHERLQVQYYSHYFLASIVIVNGAPERPGRNHTHKHDDGARTHDSSPLQPEIHV